MSEAEKSSESSASSTTSLTDDISGCLSTLESVKFGFIELKNCNAYTSTPFTLASCDSRNIKETKGTANYILDSRSLFRKAIASLKDFTESKTNPNESLAAAIQKLQTFHDDKGKDYVQIQILH